MAGSDHVSFGVVDEHLTLCQPRNPETFNPKLLPAEYKEMEGNQHVAKH